MVSDNLAGFQEMYHPIWQDKFKDVIDLSDGRFQIDRSEAGLKLLAQHINSNVYRQMDNLLVPTNNSKE